MTKRRKFDMDVDYDIESSSHVPERMLLAALLERNLRDLFEPDQHVVRGALHWFSSWLDGYAGDDSENHDNHISYKDCVTVLTLSADQIQKLEYAVKEARKHLSQKIEVKAVEIRKYNGLSGKRSVRYSRRIRVIH